MKKHIIYKKINDFIYFVWLIILILISTTTTYFYNVNKKSQIEFLNKSLKNIYLHKFIKNTLKTKFHIKMGEPSENLIDLITAIVFVGLQKNLIHKLQYITYEHPFRIHF